VVLAHRQPLDAVGARSSDNWRLGPPARLPRVAPPIGGRPPPLGRRLFPGRGVV